jgi:2'-5' RNA ligase
MSAARSDNVDRTGDRSTVESTGPAGAAVEPGAPITVGVAISIPQPWAEILDAVRASSGDPLAAFIPAHVTLLGPTDIDPDRIGEAEARLAAAAAAHAPFAVHLRGTGTFRPVTEVVFVAVATGIGECERLATDVRQGPLLRDLHYPYHPHVTIAHEVPTAALDRVYAELADFEALFTADHFTLYVHGSDGRWRPLRDFKLTGEPAAQRCTDSGSAPGGVSRSDGPKETGGVSPPPTP